MEERSLKVLEADTTFFNKITSTLSKLLAPTRVGINSILINMKRNNVLKNYESYIALNANDDETRKEQVRNRYEESYSLYLESIDKYIMDSVYKKVKKGIATDFEKSAITSYYNIVHLKENEYLEYKYRKQKFLLELDYENLKVNGKDKIIQKFENLYVSKVEGLYKGIIKNYSVKLSDVKAEETGNVALYSNIFSTLEDYIKNVLPLKMKIDESNNTYEKIKKDYEEFEKFTVGKLDEKEFIEKNMILLGLSRVLFTHSLPLVAAEQCYNKLLKDARNLVVNTTDSSKKEEAYGMVIKLIEDYNVKLLSTKVYWDKPSDREKYKKFWNAYTNSKNSQEKEVLILKREISELENTEKYNLLKKYYKTKLAEVGEMKTLKAFGTLEAGPFKIVKGKITRKESVASAN